MHRWWVANGGPLAVVVLGLTLAGVTTAYGWVLVGMGSLWWLGPLIWKRVPWEIRRRDQAAERGEPRQDAALYALFESWAKPAFETARQLLGDARDSLPLGDDLAVLIQRVLDDADRTFAAASNAIVSLDGADQEAALGDFYRQYQGMRTYMQRATQERLITAEVLYGEWRRLDQRFLDELRLAIGNRDRETLRRRVNEVGWGETVTARLPESAPREAERVRWQASAYVSAEGQNLMFDLKSLIGAQLVRGFRCDVRMPTGGIPASVSDGRTGPRERVWFTFPENLDYPMSGLIPGKYESVWYEADEDWNWVEIARADVEVPQLDAPGKAFQ